jgi:hypothetical protein
MDTKRCPYCGEEILAVAKKCKHCGEMLEKEEPLGCGGRIVPFFILAGIGWALFHFGSWHLILGKKISILSQLLSAGAFKKLLFVNDILSSGKLKPQNFILGENGVLLRINDGYYGFVMDTHFFDSPVIQ